MSPPTGRNRIHPARIQRLNDRGPAPGRYVLYWMQQSQRARFNHALEYAVAAANQRRQPLLVGFGLMDDYPGANLRHYRFLLEGLRETQGALRDQGIRMTVARGRPDSVALELAREASLVVCDRGYLRQQKLWRQRVADAFDGEVVQVESDAVVPVAVASPKAETAARTLRPRIHRHLDEYLVHLRSSPVARDSLGLSPDVDGVDLDDLDAPLSPMKLDQSVPPVACFRGGARAAEAQLRAFLRRRLDGYAEQRGQPELEHVSHLSPYLHLGQISPLQVALRVRDAEAPATDREALLEELIVRRELAFNFVHYTGGYDEYDALPAWARATLEEHRDDPRPHLYSRGQLEAAETHDPYWNAAMREMKHTGYMHNHMRMYWGKKILEWSRSPELAYRVALELNNRYFLDGRDPASYANVGWIFGLHDRPWPGRAVYGTVRSMSAAGLERKADMAAYVARVDGLVDRLSGSEPASGG
jgi:deoxyribodipyrimidine photo-lyase